MDHEISDAHARGPAAGDGVRVRREDDAVIIGGAPAVHPPTKHPVAPPADTRTPEAAAEYAERRAALTRRVKRTLIERLGFDKEDPEEIPDECLLFGAGLGLESVDGLEVVVALEQEFEVELEAADDLTCLYSVNRIVDFLLERQRMTAQAEEETKAREAERARECRQLRASVGLVPMHRYTRLALGGPDCVAVLNALVGAHVRDVLPDVAVQTLVPSPSGGVQAIVQILVRENEYWILADPEDHLPLLEVLEEAVAEHDATLTDLGHDHFMYALVGPDALDLAAKQIDERCADLAFRNVITVGETPLVVARVGTVGEPMLQIIGPASEEQRLVERLKYQYAGKKLATSEESFRVLMLENGTLNRHRHVPADATVTEAGLAWMVDYGKKDLRAGDALRAARRAPGRKCVTIVTDAPPKEAKHDTVMIAEKAVGTVRDAVHSPALDRTVGLAWIDMPFAVPGLECTLHTSRTPVTTLSAPAVLSNTVRQAMTFGMD